MHPDGVDVYFPRVNGVSTSIQTLRQALAAVLDQIDPADFDLVHIQTPFLVQRAGHAGTGCRASRPITRCSRNTSTITCPSCRRRGWRLRRA